jgi:inorganic pyrophosphatase
LLVYCQSSHSAKRCARLQRLPVPREYLDAMLSSKNQKAISELPPLGPNSKESKTIQVIIETPRNCRNKFKFNPSDGLFELGSVLPAGSVFPYDFGFVPGTEADDGDPIDVLLLMDSPAFPGCRVVARLIGVIEAEQTEGKNTIRNDRLVAVAMEAHDYRELKSVKDICPHLLREIEQFFESYNRVRGKKFTLLGQRGPKPAWKLLKKAIVRRKRARRKRN